MLTGNRKQIILGSLLVAAAVALLAAGLVTWSIAKPQAHRTNSLAALVSTSVSAKQEPSVGSGGSAIFVHKGNYPADSLLEPTNKLWEQARKTTVPLMRQDIVVPVGGGSIKALEVRAMHVPSGLAIHFEWPDATKDNETVHQVKFRDAVAIEFPIGDVKDTVLAMGRPHGPVDIWQWKADWEPDAPRMNDLPYEAVSEKAGGEGTTVYSRLHVDSAMEPNASQGKGGPTTGVFNLFPQSMHKSPVEDIVAIGVSSVTSKPDQYQVLRGRGVWHDGKWQVVIFKPLDDNNDPSSPHFQAGEQINAAFAVWNGSQEDRNGMKSISNWTQVAFH
ncbi:MAG: hypothetical protein HY711_04390 [Candidatus Melainabacteria bacterium]|nr:hypothetical protein [Candidatus Melainabacteria bacterium]